MKERLSTCCQNAMCLFLNPKDVFNFLKEHSHCISVVCHFKEPTSAERIHGRPYRRVLERRDLVAWKAGLVKSQHLTKQTLLVDFSRCLLHDLLSIHEDICTVNLSEGNFHALTKYPIRRLLLALIWFSLIWQTFRIAILKECWSMVNFHNASGLSCSFSLAVRFRFVSELSLSPRHQSKTRSAHNGITVSLVNCHIDGCQAQSCVSDVTKCVVEQPLWGKKIGRTGIDLNSIEGALYCMWR